VPEKMVDGNLNPFVRLHKRDLMQGR
jgi:hypothetical protein